PLGPAKLVLWPLIGWSSVIAIVAGVRMHRPDGRGAWFLLAGGVATFIVGDDLYSFRNVVQHSEAMFPSYVDIVYLAMYPLLIAGLSLLIRRRTPGRDRASLLDAAIITVGVGLLSWVILIVPYVRTDDMTLPERLTSIAYPMGDVALLAIAVRLAFGSGRRPFAFWLLAGSIVPLLTADGFYGYLNLAGTWREHSAVDIGWIIFYVGWGAAALHPSMRSLSLPAHSAPTSRGRLVLVGSAALIAPAVLFVEQLLGPVVDGTAIALTAAVLFGLVLSRSAGLARDVAEARSEARFRSLVDNASDAIIVVDDDGCFRYLTPSAERLLGCDASDLLHKPLGDVLIASDAQQLRVFLSASDASAVTTWRVPVGDDALRDMEVIVADLRGDPQVGGVVLTMRDVTERMALDAELRRQALHDTLTGLPNRSLFNDRISHALSRAVRNDHGIAVLFLDIDDFKFVNDSLGHPAGDEILVGVAARLATHVKAGDTVARLGGDEFAVLLEGAEDITRSAEEVAERLQEALEQSFEIGDDFISVHASIGIAVGWPDTATADQLLRDADLAMYVAKHNGKARFERFAPEMHEKAIRRLEIASELKGAIEGGELELFYQPIVSVATGRPSGVEALVRWNHPRRGLMQPNEFIPVAESTGLVIPLGRWVLGEACRQVRQWQRQGRVDEDFYVSVNLSARHLHDRGVVDDVTAALDTSGLAPAALLVEVTESALVEDLDPSGTRLADLKSIGVRLAIDDFGTGYSSLARLSTFPLDVVKIDKSFIDRLLADHDGEAMVRAVVDLSHTLGMSAIAEGVEHEEQALALQHLGCTMAQGYLFARPMPASEVVRVFDPRKVALATQP
ncbi:MAG: putative bifunctional diguanylate cyclase/phosphodiesterase, partial [Acidimicrobiales bacterium]